MESKETMSSKTEREIRNNIFKELSNAITPDDLKVLNENKKIKYIPWAVAWDRATRLFPSAEYKVLEDQNGRQYFYDDLLDNFTVKTEVTIEGITHNMWATVTSNNLPMRRKPYEIAFTKSTFTIPACTMNDINRAIMRCLTKNLAMFGLGLWVYAGEEFMLYEDEYDGRLTDLNDMLAPPEEKIPAVATPIASKNIDDITLPTVVTSKEEWTLEKALGTDLETIASVKTFKEIWENPRRETMLDILTKEDMKTKRPRDYQIATFLKGLLAKEVSEG